MSCTAKYGEWKSPITSDVLVKGNCKTICELQVRQGKAFWTEQTFPVGTRVLYEQEENNTDPSKPGIQWSPNGVSVSTAVHEYGGGSFYVSDTAPEVYVSHKGGVYELTQPQAPLKPITKYPPGTDFRHADLFTHGEFIYAVQEIHNVEAGGEPQNLLVRMDRSTGEVTTVAEGSDFYAEPRVSPDGKHLVWLEWNKPYMPWDQTSVHIADIGSDGHLSNARKLLDNASHSSLQWTPTDPTTLHVLSDTSGYWNIYELDTNSGQLGENLYPTNMDIGGPFWVFANVRPFAISKSHMVVVVDGKLLHKSRADGSNFQAIQSANSAGFTVFACLIITNDDLLYAIASGSKRSASVIRVDMKQMELSVIRETRNSSELEKLGLSIGQLKSFQSDGVEVQGYYYPPTNSSYKSTEGDLPPALFFAHPGPTMQTTDDLDMKKQFFTSKGFAIFDINYRGSTGRGRDYRNLLLGNWGIVDTNDMINGAKYLVEQKLADPNKLCIIGSSAGGYLALSVLIHPENKFSAAVSIYGVADLEDLMKATHKFEADYTVRLVAPYPEGIDEYQRRSPFHNLEKVKTPVAFIHGTDDPVVSCKQSEAFYEALKAKKITTALKLFPGESHGFRSTEAVTKSMDISYVFFCRVLGLKPSVETEIEIIN